MMLGRSRFGDASMPTSPSFRSTSHSGSLELTPRAKAALTALGPVLAQAALAHSAPVQSVEVSRFIDPDDDSQEIVVTQWVELPLEAALDYWEKLASAIEEWIAALPSDLAREAKGIALEVRSAIDEPGV